MYLRDQLAEWEDRYPEGTQGSSCSRTTLEEHIGEVFAQLLFTPPLDYISKPSRLVRAWHTRHVVEAEHDTVLSAITFNCHNSPPVKILGHFAFFAPSNRPLRELRGIEKLALAVSIRSLGGFQRPRD